MGRKSYEVVAYIDADYEVFVCADCGDDERMTPVFLDGDALYDGTSCGDCGLYWHNDIGEWSQRETPDPEAISAMREAVDDDVL